ncbi:hypothetical protein [Legionella fallonii]|uniref:Coiled-coil-containing protein n=1 Tax=Legionella fallonii LLAP-10 TaxID=1212491 RepID=A0A098G5C6_9GAMM|nr:hypothetical protein [Legionella fallonii]CEG57184.1 protein of unknown function [Legionella fallonii LLAP-10]
MPKNSLYNVINKVTYHKKNIPGVVNLSLRTHHEGKQYFFFELPLPHEIVIGDYTLVDHHLSVYESPMSKFDMKSQHHYTAYFKGQDGERYRLHIYYDANDDSICEPLLSIVQDENVFQSVNCWEQYEAFKGLAEQFISDVVNHLRRTQRETVTAYNEQYKELEEQAISLSVDCVKNKAEYLAVIKMQIEILEESKLYSNDSRATNRLLSFLRRVTKSLELPAIEPVVLEDSAAPIPAPKEKTNRRNRRATSQAQKKQVAESSSPASVPRVKSKKTNSKPRLDEVISSLKLQFEQLEQMKDRQLIRAITVFFGDLIVKECTLEQGKYQASVQDIQALYVLRTQSEDLAERLLKRLLIMGHYAQANLLSSFYHTLPHSMMPYALTHNKPELINFLLKNKIVPLNYKNFVIKETHYNSLFDFYFRQEPTQQLLMIDSIDVLIKNGSSLLMEIDSNTGLPFAAIILLEPKHPFRMALERNAGITINNPMFYKQLNQILQALIAQSSYPKEKATEINNLIQQNKGKINLLAMPTPSGEPSLMQLTEDMTDKLKATLGEEFVNDLLFDPEIAALRILIQERQAALLLKLPTSARAEVRQETKENFEAIKKDLDEIENVDLILSIRENIRSRVIQQQLDTINIISLREELIQVQTLIKGTVLHQGKRNKEYNALLKRQDKIIADLKAYNKADKSDKKAAKYESTVFDLETLQDQLAEMEKSFESLASFLKPLCDLDASDKENDETGAYDGRMEEKMSSLFNQKLVKTLFPIASSSTSIGDKLADSSETPDEDENNTIRNI